MFIEEQREKNKFEGSLPPTSDEACFILRRKLMEGQEIREWQKREKNIKKLQKNKLNLLQTLLEERERLAERENQDRVAKLKQKKTEKKNLLKVKIDKKKVKILRKMETLRRGFARLGRKKGLIEEYRDFASRVYANMTRQGLCPKSLGKEFNFDFEGFQRLDDFNAFVEKLNKDDLEFELQLDQILELNSEKMTKMERLHRGELEKAQDKIRRTKDQKENLLEVQYDNLKITNVVARLETEIFDKMQNFPKTKTGDAKPDTKTLDRWNRLHRAAVLFQTILRGRAVQVD